MKKNMKLLIALALIVASFSGCSNDSTEIGEVVTEPTGQSFNSIDKYLHYELETESGEKQDAAVIATIEEGQEVKKEAYNAAKPQDRQTYEEFLEEFSDVEMKFVKTLVRVFPYNGSDFSNGDALLTMLADLKDTPTSEYTGAINEFRKDSPMKNISSFNWYIFDSEDKAVMFASMFLLMEDETPYYEGVIYSIIPVDLECNLTFGFVSKKFEFLEAKAPNGFPDEGYLCWRLNDTQLEAG